MVHSFFTRVARGFVPLCVVLLLDVVLFFTVKICELIITTPNPSTTTVLSRPQYPQRGVLFGHTRSPPCSSPFLYHSIPLISSPSSFPPPFPFVLRSSALSASSHPWRPLTRSSPYALSSDSYSVPFRFIGIWKVKHRPNPRFFRSVMN